MRLLLDFDSDSLRASRIVNDDDLYTAFNNDDRWKWQDDGGHIVSIDNENEDWSKSKLKTDTVLLVITRIPSSFLTNLFRTVINFPQ